MRIILLTSSKTRSGGARQACYQAEIMAARGHEVFFFLPKESALWDLPHQAQWHALPDERAAWRTLIESFLPPADSEAPAIVHAFHNKACKLVAWWGLLWRGRALCVSHRGVLNRPNNPLPYLSPGLAAVVPNSQACARVLWACPTRKIHVIPNGIPDERLIPGESAETVRARLGIDPHTLVFGFVGHNGLIKGGDILLEAFARVLTLSDVPGACSDVVSAPAPLHLIGVGLDPKHWQAHCEQHFTGDWQGSVHLVGAQEDVASYLQLFDVLIVPSRSESLPNTLLEGIRMGLPVIGSNVGGIPECIQGNGILVPPADAAALASAMRAMFDPAQRALFADASRTLGARYTPEARCNALEALYLQLAGKQDCHVF